LCTAQTWKNLTLVSLYNLLQMFFAVMYICLVNNITSYIWNIFSSVYLSASSFSWPHFFLPPSKRCLCASFIYCEVLKQLLCFLSLNCSYLTFPGYKQKLAPMRQWDSYWNVTLTCRVLRFLVLMIHFRFLYPTVLTAFMIVIFNHIQVLT
jgi:hypothetical protein